MVVGSGTVATLPPPPPGREGWPWTDSEEVPAIPDRTGGWPRITIVTPSYNQSPYLEETIRSVLLQGYPELEYIVIDGGSTDSSVDILRRYEGWLTHWVSERDNGQSEAINKGFARASGKIHGYLNSDDAYRPNALVRVAAAFLHDPNALHAFPVVDVEHRGSSRIRSVPLRRRSPVAPVTCTDRPDPPAEGEVWEGGLVPLMVGELYLHQPGVFWPAVAYFAHGGFDERYSFMFDQKFFLDLALAGLPLICHGGAPVASFRHHAQSKTIMSRQQGMNPFSLELWRIARELEPRLKRSERDLVRQKRVQRTLGRVWRELRSGSGRRGALRVLARGLADHPDLVTDRFFWATLLAVGRTGRIER
jgi:hypothetical protein